MTLLKREETTVPRAAQQRQGVEKVMENALLCVLESRKIERTCLGLTSGLLLWLGLAWLLLCLVLAVAGA